MADEFTGRKFIGGRQDGNVVKVANDVKVGQRFNLPAIGPQTKTEVYELQADGAFHFIGYDDPPTLLTGPTLKVSVEVKARIEKAMIALTAAVDEAEAAMKPVGGISTDGLTFGKWILRRVVQ